MHHNYQANTLDVHLLKTAGTQLEHVIIVSTLISCFNVGVNVFVSACWVISFKSEEVSCGITLYETSMLMTV